MFKRKYIIWLSTQGEVFEVLNCCILISKYYIHTKILLEDNIVGFFNFQYELKFKISINHNICVKHNTEHVFSKFLFLYE